MKRPELPAPAEPKGDWLETVLAMPVERGWCDVAGARLELLSWGERGAPGILCAHGFAANADWWRAIAGPLSDHYRVAALSFSGMGQSDWRERYNLDLFADELDQAAKAAGLDEGPAAPLLVAHSFGGYPAIISAALSPGRWRGLVLVDSRANDSLANATGPSERAKPRVVADCKALVGRFRLMPDQPCRTPRLLAEVAERSVRRLKGADGAEGWSWATDPNLFPDFGGRSISALASTVACPMAYIHGGDSYIVRDAMLDGIRANFPPGTPVVGIPDAGHHVILDKPVAVIAAVRLLDAMWSQSREAG
jgi:pimeloyl-ACP methyl ester carboxylesterase